MKRIKVVTKPDYLRYQRFLAYAYLPSMGLLVSVNLFGFPVLVDSILLLSMTIFSLIAVYWMFRIRKSVQQTLQIDGNQAEITDRKKNVIEKGQVIGLEDLYNQFEIDTSENFKRMWKHLFGKMNVPSIELKTEQGTKKFYFLIESYYHYNQLKSLQKELEEPAIKQAS